MNDPSIPEVLLQRFNQSYDHMKDIHGALRKMEGASITNENMEHLGISVAEMEIKTGSPSPYFVPSEEKMPNPNDEKVDDEPFASQPWDCGPPGSWSPPYYYLMLAFSYYQIKMKWLNRYLPEDDEDEKSTEKSKQGKSEEDMGEEDVREEGNDEKEHNGEQEGNESPESEEDMCEHEESSEWDSDEESDKESEEYAEQRRKRREEWHRRNEERQRKIYEAEEARMVYEWNVYHYPRSYGFEPRENHHDFRIIRIGHRNNPLQCHQWAMVLIDKSDENRPSITELLVLVNRMLKAMNLQKGRISTSQNHDNNNQLHHLFPTTIVTFDKYTRARVLSGYYNDGLKVHFTESLNFDPCTRYRFLGPSYEREWVSDREYGRMMRCLAAWTWPIAQMNTALTFTLPIISRVIGNRGNQL